MTVAVVLDTVVLLQAAAKPSGPAGACLRLVTDGQAVLWMSREGLAEIEDVLNRPKVRQRFKSLTDAGVATFLTGLRGRARVMDDVPLTFPFPRDPDDEHVLNLALAARANFLVTRDNDLLDLMRDDSSAGAAFRQQFPNLTISDPVAFLKAVHPEPPDGPTPTKPA
jgi:putative PIN family toxin of toxin-antitoxin system